MLLPAFNHLGDLLRVLRRGVASSASTFLLYVFGGHQLVYFRSTLADSFTCASFRWHERLVECPDRWKPGVDRGGQMDAAEAMLEIRHAEAVPAASGTRDFSAGRWAASNPATRRWCARFRSRPIRRNREPLAASMPGLRTRSSARNRGWDGDRSSDRMRNSSTEEAELR